MLHYRTVVRKAGPLKKTMVFRFEQKHQELKQYARACYSRVNLPYSIICSKFCLESSRLFLDKRDVFTIIKDLFYLSNTHKEGMYSCEVTNPIKTLRYRAVQYDLGDLIYHNKTAFKIRQMVKGLNTDEIYLCCNRLGIQYVENLRYFKIVSEHHHHEILQISSLIYAPVNIHTISKCRYFRPINTFKLILCI